MSVGVCVFSFLSSGSADILITSCTSIFAYAVSKIFNKRIGVERLITYCLADNKADVNVILEKSALTTYKQTYFAFVL